MKTYPKEWPNENSNGSAKTSVMTKSKGWKRWTSTAPAKTSQNSNKWLASAGAGCSKSTTKHKWIWLSNMQAMKKGNQRARAASWVKRTRKWLAIIGTATKNTCRSRSSCRRRSRRSRRISATIWLSRKSSTSLKGTRDRPNNLTLKI